MMIALGRPLMAGADIDSIFSNVEELHAHSGT
jgi:hypothetical protein